MKKTNYIALIAAGLAAISVFLPWLEANSSLSFGNYSSSYSSGGVSGIAIGGGIWGLFVALGGLFLALKNNRWAFIAGVINVYIGVGYMLGWFSAGANSSFSYGNDVTGIGSARVSLDPQIGLYLFVFASIAFVIFTLKNLAPGKAK